MKYLVDLNYTLVGNSPKWGEPRITPFSRQIEQETYRQWLVDFLRDKHAILITARPDPDIENKPLKGYCRRLVGNRRKLILLKFLHRRQKSRKI